MLIRVYCGKDHPRREFVPREYDQTAHCTECGAVVTREALYQSLPDYYKRLVDTDLGGVLASFADIGAIDLIFHGRYPLNVEYARERDVDEQKS